MNGWDEPVVVEEGTYGGLGRYVESGSDDGPRPTTAEFCARKQVTEQEMEVAKLAAGLLLKGQPVEALIAHRVADWKRQIVVMHVAVRINNDSGWICTRARNSQLSWIRLQTASMTLRVDGRWRHFPGGIDNPIEGAEVSLHEKRIQRRQATRRQLHVDQLHALRDKLGRVPSFAEYRVAYGASYANTPCYWQSDEAPTQAAALDAMWRAAGMERPKKEGWETQSDERAQRRAERDRAKETA